MKIQKPLGIHLCLNFLLQLNLVNFINHTTVLSYFDSGYLTSIEHIAANIFQADTTQDQL